MIITESIYNKVIKYTNKIARMWPREFREDLQQDVFEKIHTSKEDVEYETTYLYKTTKNTFLNKKIARDRFSKVCTEFGDVLNLDSKVLPDLSVEAKIDLKTLADTFQDEPAKYKTLSFMIDNPDMSWQDMSDGMKINNETFKANLKHIRSKIKNEGWV
jgi:DNA-directed RNA polymerase specialized sigma24 family protein